MKCKLVDPLSLPTVRGDESVIIPLVVKRIEVGAEEIRSRFSYTSAGL
jgi:hypothetical protein